MIKHFVFSTILFLFFSSLVLSCDAVDKKKNCCYDNECTGEICQKGCGMICCAKFSRKAYDFTCKAIAKFLAGKAFPVLSCLNLGIFSYQVCAPEAAPFLLWGQIGCASAGIGLYAACSIAESAIAEPLCDRFIKRKTRSLLFLDDNFLSHPSYPEFPENYSMNITTYLNQTVTKTSLIKSKNNNNYTNIFYKSRYMKETDQVFYFDFEGAGRTVNLTSNNCSSVQGTYEDMDQDFLDFFLTKLHIQDNFVFTSQQVYENKLNSNLWTLKKNLNESRYVEIHYFEDSASRTPLEIRILMNSDIFARFVIDDFSKDAKIDMQNEYFEECNTCKGIDSCEGVKTNSECGWCPIRNKTFPIDPINGGVQFPFECESDPNTGVWTTKVEDCVCLNITAPEGIKATKNCGWCPFYKKAYHGTKEGPSGKLICPSTPQDGQWTWDSKNIKCLTVNKCSDTSNTNCGWCPYYNRSFIGDFNGPTYNITCPTSPEGQWTYYTNDCKCLEAEKCDDIKDTNCGWCPSTNKALIGDQSGPYWNATCPVTEGKDPWIKSYKDCHCSNATKCSDISGTENCGWCPSLKKGFFGNANGPANGVHCPTTEEGQWTYYTKHCKCLEVKSCSDTKGTDDCGWCSVLA